MKNLEGIGVLLTRPEGNSAEFIGAIDARGGTAFVCPMIEIAPPLDWAPCDSAIGRLDAYDAVLFTSANAVRNFLARCAELGRTFPGSPSRGIFAVGSATAETLRWGGVERVDVAAEPTGRGLADAVLARYRAASRFLLPRGDQGREECVLRLKEAGNSVDDPVVYRTCAPDPERLKRAEELIRGGKIQVVTFASPSAARNFTGAISAPRFAALSPRPRVVAVGPTTAAALRDLGYPLDGTAAEPTASGFLTVIEQVAAL